MLSWLPTAIRMPPGSTRPAPPDAAGAGELTQLLDAVVAAHRDQDAAWLEAPVAAGGHRQLSAAPLADHGGAGARADPGLLEGHAGQRAVLGHLHLRHQQVAAELLNPGRAGADARRGPRRPRRDR